MFKKIVHLFDRLEDKIRGRLSRYPILYALFGGVGVVLFWRGVWHSADGIPFLENSWVSIAVGSLILLVIGVFVSVFVGNKLILSGLRGEKKMAEKTKEEIDEEEAHINKMQSTMSRIEDEMAEIKKEIQSHHPKK